MKRVRITYPGAFHHDMNRGYEGNDIFAGNKNEARFLEFLEGKAKKMINTSIHLNRTKILTLISTALFFFLTQTLSNKQGQNKGEGQ